ncbi:hypothetical protein CVT24_013251 [Panaeolus cyanescens]|uniref:Uncharacterized protein n=1 Tax=Panaeolus cyanescens TaxID=181874 RepID=A0A409YMY4_9AGAR|nr:hypothetical protein CVT24_013251 [Panaeolus cyanescens]
MSEQQDFNNANAITGTKDSTTPESSDTVKKLVSASDSETNSDGISTSLPASKRPSTLFASISQKFNDFALSVVNDSTLSEVVQYAEQGTKNLVTNDLIAHGATLEKSLNTQESALQIIDGLCGRWSRQLLAFRNVSHPFAESPFIPGLIAELQGRIAQLQAHKTVLEEDLTRLGNTPTKLSDPMLHVVLKERIKEVEDGLMRFESQLLQFGRPRSPLPTGFSTSLPVESTNDAGRVSHITGADRRDHLKKFAKKMLKGIGL